MELQELTLEKLTSKYSDDYFDTETLYTFKKCLELLQSIENGSFEYDTWHTDKLLYDLRNAINKIDI